MLKTFLSKREGLYTLIFNGSPLSRPVSLRDAERIAASYNIVLPDVFFDADSGEFLSMDTE
jgi:hypothetical protein